MLDFPSLHLWVMNVPPMAQVNSLTTAIADGLPQAAQRSATPQDGHQAPKWNQRPSNPKVILSQEDNQRWALAANCSAAVGLSLERQRRTQRMAFQLRLQRVPPQQQCCRVAIRDTAEMGFRMPGKEVSSRGGASSTRIPWQGS